jgi:hypothetical protein
MFEGSTVGLAAAFTAGPISFLSPRVPPLVELLRRRRACRFLAARGVCNSPGPRLRYEPMSRSRPAFRLLVTAATVLFLACQSIAVAKMWAAGALEAAPEAAMELCPELHDEARGGSAHDKLCKSPCQHAPVSSYKSDAKPPAAVDLPFITAYVDLVATRGIAAPAVEYRPTHWAAPPLPILHCRLRN